MESKSYKSKMKQNNYTELLGFSFNNIYSKNDPPDVVDPTSVFFSGFFGTSYRKSVLFRPIVSTGLIVSPKKVVGCRGWIRYVEGCWRFPYLKIEKLPD